MIEQRDRWYMDDNELTKELCEEVQKSDYFQPEVINDCCACNEAKYEVLTRGKILNSSFYPFYFIA